MNIGKWVKTQKQFFILGKEIKPKAKWEASTNGTDYRVCSNCLYERHAGTKYNYCPVCGADMRGEE